MTNPTMTRREFTGWMVASVAAMVAGSRVWKLFQRLAEEGEATSYIGQFYVGESVAILRNDKPVSNALGTITAIRPGPDGHLTEMDITWNRTAQLGLRDGDSLFFANGATL